MEEIIPEKQKDEPEESKPRVEPESKLDLDETGLNSCTSSKEESPVT